MNEVITNYEHYKDDIIERVSVYDGMRLAVDTRTGKPRNCADTNCNDCEFHYSPAGLCAAKRRDWLNAPYIEPKPKLTKKERAFLEVICSNGYIVRLTNGLLIYFDELPMTTYKYHSVIILDKDYFSFIKWEDEQLWSVEELLKLKVEED